MPRQNKLAGPTFSQLLLAERLAERVEKWADDSLPVDQRWNGTTATTHFLLRYWFDRDEEATMRFHDCQRRALETLVYCHEVLRTTSGDHIANLRDLYMLVAPEALEYGHIAEAVEDSDYRKYCLKLATGTGKTWILQAALVWQYFNALREAETRYYSQHFLVVAPGLVVLDRLSDAFLGKPDEKGNRDPNSADLRLELFMPPEWRKDFHLRVLHPEDINPTSTPQEGPFVILLNWHKIVPRSDEVGNLAEATLGPDFSEDTARIYQDFLTSFPDLVVFNDEAHHVHNKAKKGSQKDANAKWLEAVKALQHDIDLHFQAGTGLFMQVDFSATPFYGAGEKKEYFAHIAYDYDLKHAMNGWSPVKKEHIGLPLVKQLFLEERQSVLGDLEKLDFRAVREAEEGTKRGTIVDLSKGQKLMLDIGIKKLDQIAAEFEKSGIEKKPVLYVACEENEVADLVADWLGGKSDAMGRPLADQVLVMHSDKKKEVREDEWKEVRYQLDTIDNPANPKRILVSVLMLREGFDVQNICVAVVLRSSESDILLEQMVGRGLRLMFKSHEYEETKRQALVDIAEGREPSALLDFLFIVEHPRFRQFYDNLRSGGYPVIKGDSSRTVTSGDLEPVEYDKERLKQYDLTWPVQFHDEGKVPDPSNIQVASLHRYPMSFPEAKRQFDAILIGDRHKPTEKVVSTWALRTDVFDYNFFLREVVNSIVTPNKGTTILSAKRAELMRLVDEYVSTRLFPGDPVDFNDEENYRVLAHITIVEFVVTAVRNALVDLLGKVVYEPHPEAVWEKVSKVAKILVRKKNSVPTTKCIYPIVSPAPKGGGFEARLIWECLERSSSVVAYVKLDQHKHNFAIRYRNEYGIARDYYPDFIVKTKDRMYLVETKADRDMSSPVVARKAKAAIGWCEAASRIDPPKEFDQPKEWEYVLLSEKTYANHGRAGFDALLSGCRSELQQLLAYGRGRLF